MPKPSFASRRNSLTLLSAFGQPVTLQDGSVISAIVRSRRLLTYGNGESVERRHTVLSVPRMLAGTLAQHQFVTVNGERLYVASVVEDGLDGWLVAALSESPTTP